MVRPQAEDEDPGEGAEAAEDGKGTTTQGFELIAQTQDQQQKTFQTFSSCNQEISSYPEDDELMAAESLLPDEDSSQDVGLLAENDEEEMLFEPLDLRRPLGAEIDSDAPVLVIQPNASLSLLTYCVNKRDAINHVKKRKKERPVLHSKLLKQKASSKGTGAAQKNRKALAEAKQAAQTDPVGGPSMAAKQARKPISKTHINAAKRAKKAPFAAKIIA